MKFKYPMMYVHPHIGIYILLRSGRKYKRKWVYMYSKTILPSLLSLLESMEINIYHFINDKKINNLTAVLLGIDLDKIKKDYYEIKKDGIK